MDPKIRSVTREMSEDERKSRKLEEIRHRLSLETDGAVPDHVRARLVAEVRRRLEAGELDSDLARIETALALLDGDLSGQG